MKKFPIHQMLGVVVVGMLFVSAYIISPSFLKAPRAESATTDNVSGWTWSENIGWISFNNTSDLSSQFYGVNVDTANKAVGGTGDFSGNAWIGDSDLTASDTIVPYHTGWGSFDRAKTGNPPGAPFNSGSGPIAQVDWSNGKVTGWMRVLSACKNTYWDGTNLDGPKCTASGAGDAAGGWDGWIKLSSDPSDSGSSYGVTISSNNFSGYAWGSDVVGWVSFDPIIGGIDVGPVVGATSCSVTDPTITWGTCQRIGVCPDDAGSTEGIRAGVCASGGTVTGACTLEGLTCDPLPAGCGNNICESSATVPETFISCPQDCKIKYERF